MEGTIELSPRRNRIAVLVSVAAASWLACSPPVTEDEGRESRGPARIMYGTTMGHVARRFELLGRAAQAGRFELAEYLLHEIAEQFEETLPHVARPHAADPNVLPALESDFLKTNVPDLRRALTARDQTEVAAAFARTATACNGCHRATDHAFIEVPTAPGRSIPNIDPLRP
jgi:hypothetical protein